MSSLVSGCFYFDPIDRDGDICINHDDSQTWIPYKELLDWLVQQKEAYVQDGIRTDDL